MDDKKRKPPQEIISEYEYHNPVDRYAQLPEPTRRWLEHLRPGELDEIEEALNFLRSVKSTTRFVKWLTVSAIAVLLLMSQLGESFLKVWHMFVGPRP